MMRGKISYLIPTLKLAGTSTQAMVFCESMIAAGYEVELVVLSKKGVFLDAMSGTPYAVHYLKTAKYFSKFFTVFYLIRYLRQHRPDILFGGAKGVNKLAIYAHILSARVSRLAVILTNDMLQKKGPNERGRWMSQIWHLFLYRFANHIIVLSEAAKQVFLKASYESSKITVLPPPINVKAVQEKSLEPLNHPWLEEPKGTREIPVILAVGRIAAQKNYPLLLEAFKTAQQTRPLRMIVLGTGTDKATAATQKLAEDYGIDAQIEFTGFSNNPFQYMRRSDVFALSSHWEGFGIVVAEALACGLTVVSVDCPEGPREILQDGKYGYLAKLHDAESLARALLAGLDAPMEPEPLMKRAGIYDSAVISQQYQRLIRFMTDAP